MPRCSTRPLVPVLTLLALILLIPALATAQPHHGGAVLSAAESPGAGLSLVAKLRNRLSGLWAKTGSGLDPNGAGTSASSGPGTEPNPASPGDTGSGLDPDGRR